MSWEIVKRRQYKKRILRVVEETLWNMVLVKSSFSSISFPLFLPLISSALSSMLCIKFCQLCLVRLDTSQASCHQMKKGQDEEKGKKGEE